MFPTDSLQEDHRLMQRMCQVIDAVAQRLERGEEVPVAVLESIVDFMNGFGLKFHLDRESAVFSHAYQNSVENQDSEIAATLMIHEEGQNLGDELWEALQRIKQGEEEARLEFADTAIEYAHFVGNHMEDEDRNLFPKIDGVLSDDDRQELRRSFEQIEARPEGNRHRFQKMVDLLELEYRKAA